MESLELPTIHYAVATDRLRSQPFKVRYETALHKLSVGQTGQWDALPDQLRKLWLQEQRRRLKQLERRGDCRFTIHSLSQ